ncbi:MAG: DUF4886 domain-containing protein [Oscillospiraceae bacterium]|nr:DUF4886 domain-containing protein [Oscillospiraceae bacterium]
MKKLLAMLLAVLMLLGAFPLANAAFTDEGSIGETYKKAVDEISALGVIGGFTDGSFGPKQILTRAQAAKILCVMLEGAEKADALTKTETGFDDVPASHWAAKYVAYCVEKGVVAGVGDGKFDPDGKLTAAAFGKMLLVAYGADAAKFTGAEWMKNVQDSVGDAFLDYKAGNFDSRELSRQEAAQLAWNTLFAKEADEAATKDMASRPMPKSVPESIKIYSIGSSFSNNCVLGYLYEMLQAVGVKNVTLGALYASGASLQTHLDGAKTGEPKYKYYKRDSNGTGKWKTNKKVTFDQALKDEDWDIISFMQTPSHTYQPAKNQLMYYVQKAHPDANFVWNQIWAHAKTSKQSAFVDLWDADQDKMYSGMIGLLQQHVLPDPRIRTLMPTGTAIQNARTSFLGDNLDRDTYHLNKGIGYYIASMTWCCALTGCSPEQITLTDKLLKYPPRGFDANTPGLLDALVKVAQESVANALAKPFEVTQSKYKTFPG